MSLVSEKGSNSTRVTKPVDAKPFANVPSNSGEFPYVRCTEWLKKQHRYETVSGCCDVRIQNSLRGLLLQIQPAAFFI